MHVAADSLADEIAAALSRVDRDQLRRDYWAQNEFLYIPQFLPRDLVEAYFVPQAQAVKPELNRNFIPGHKKGGSVSYYQVAQKAPRFLALYRDPAFRAFLEDLTKASLDLCPDNDPHACALYYYTEAGDHIGFHYDTSYYKGARYTILMGVVDQSTRCRLVAQLHKDVPGKTMQELSLATAPGDLVIFNGDKLWHAVTPIDANEERIVLTMEYVTDRSMTPFNRLYSNLKDAFGYFGIRALLGRPTSS